MANANGVRKMIPVNGNIVTEFFGEGWVTERTYDLRAVLFCRNGNDYLTTPSKIISGIKDTRRPQLFGTPEPKSGLLTSDEDIIFNFSEDIEYNYLSAITNFEVKGEVNNDNISEMVSVQFAGQASVETEAKRNFSGKDLTIDMMVKPAETNRDMPLFSHGTNGQRLQLWLTSDFKLKAVVNDQTFTSSEAIGKNAFRQVALTLNQQDSTLTFFKGGVEMGRHKLNALYYGTGPLIFGRTNELDPQTKEPTGTLVRDYLFVDSIDTVLTHFDQTQAAPVVPYEEVKNLKFGFIGKGNQLLVELDENAARLNHRNIYVTVRDIEDKNGNTMASPQTACYYVANSSLQWMVNRMDVTIKYGSGEGCELPLYNGGSTSHTYTIENCPRWLTLSKYNDVLAPITMDYVDAKVSKDLNVGTYNEILYLTDEEGIAEPFYLNLTVEGDKPDWADKVDRTLLENSMSISGQVYLYGELDTDSRDIVGAFDNENVCHGFANITHNAQTGENGLFLTVYDSQASGRELSFRLWQYSTGRELVLIPKDGITFEKDAMLGSETPVRFDGGEAFVQYFNLKEGWNGIGYTPTITLSLETALSDYYDSAEPGDVIKSHTEFAYFSKTGNVGRWRGSLQYMKPGEGYMMLRKGTGQASFTYPYYELGSNSGENQTATSRHSNVQASRNTMSMMATVVGFEVEAGDRLVAYADGEQVGAAELSTVNSLLPEHCRQHAPEDMVCHRARR